jgi:hypothetical protein
MRSGRATGFNGLARNKNKNKNKQKKAQIPSPGSQWDEHERKMKAIV